MDHTIERCWSIVRRKTRDKISHIFYSNRHKYFCVCLNCLYAFLFTENVKTQNKHRTDTKNAFPCYILYFVRIRYSYRIDLYASVLLNTFIFRIFLYICMFDNAIKRSYRSHCNHIRCALKSCRFCVGLFESHKASTELLWSLRFSTPNHNPLCIHPPRSSVKRFHGKDKVFDVLCLFRFVQMCHLKICKIRKA